MGTNFYSARSGAHIGKRSAAGFYCWDCGLSLCAGGNRKVHDGVSPWHDRCPRCGKAKSDEPMEQSSAGRELGFNVGAPAPKTGVATCASFTWAMPPGRAKRLRRIRDEYGRIYTREEFSAVLGECPIRFFDNIGREFS